MKKTIVANKDSRAVVLIEKGGRIEYALVNLYPEDCDKPLLSTLDGWVSSDGYYTSLLKPLMMLEEYNEHIDAFMRDVESVANDAYEDRVEWAYHFNKLDKSTKDDIIYAVANEICEDETLAEHMNEIIASKLEAIIEDMKLEKEVK